MSTIFAALRSKKFPFELLGFIFFGIVLLLPQLQKSLCIHQCCIIFLVQPVFLQFTMFLNLWYTYESIFCTNKCYITPTFIIIPCDLESSHVMQTSALQISREPYTHTFMFQQHNYQCILYMCKFMFGCHCTLAMLEFVFVHNTLIFHFFTNNTN